MAITGNASYIPTMNTFAGHWALCNAALAPAALLVGMPDKTSMSAAQFGTLRDALQTQQTTVQAKLNDQQIARADIDAKKTQLLASLNQFNGLLEAYYQQTNFYHARPKAPGLGDGQEAFTRPMVDAMTLWQKVNAAPAPAGITLPLTLADGTDQGTFASAISALQFSYVTLSTAEQNVALARMDRDNLQKTAYEAMKSYRLAVPVKLLLHPSLIATLPVLTPAPGHTPAPVNVSGVFQPPDAAKIVHGASPDPALQDYQLRGTIGDRYVDDDAVVIATHGPTDPLEFVTTFGLNQPGAKIAVKVFVVLTTGNECGSATVVIERPA